MIQELSEDDISLLRSVEEPRNQEEDENEVAMEDVYDGVVPDVKEDEAEDRHELAFSHVLDAPEDDADDQNFLGPGQRKDKDEELVEDAFVDLAQEEEPTKDEAEKPTATEIVGEEGVDGVQEDEPSKDDAEMPKAKSVVDEEVVHGGEEAAAKKPSKDKAAKKPTATKLPQGSRTRLTAKSVPFVKGPECPLT